MSKQEKDQGTIQVVIERMKKQRIPRALRLKKKVDGGELLDDFDIQFLEEVQRDARSVLPLLQHHPQYLALTSKALDLYKAITTKELENQHKT